MNIDWHLRLLWTLQLVRTVKYLHEQKIIHRKLKQISLLWVLISKKVTFDVPTYWSIVQWIWNSLVWLFPLILIHHLFIWTDFGICFWPDLKGTVQTPPHYVGGKDIYVASEEETLTYSFDLRLERTGYLVFDSMTILDW